MHSLQELENLYHYKARITDMSDHHRASMKFLSMKDMVEKLRISRSQIYKMLSSEVERNSLPQKIYPSGIQGTGQVLYLESEVERWMRSMMEKQVGEQS